MKPVYHLSSGIFSPYGNTAAAAFKAIANGEIAIRQIEAADGSTFYGSALHTGQLELLRAMQDLSPLEAMCVIAVEDAMRTISIDLQSSNCVFVFSSTKGNIEWLGEREDKYIYLHHSAATIAGYFKNPNKPVVVSNACISGSMALLTAKRMIDAGKYKHAIVIGADRLTGFVLDGFRSFQAVAPGFCRPFDRDRQGINLGEAAACIVLSNELNETDNPIAILAGGALTNDANHLSGPSRTGAELATAITSAIEEANILPKDIAAISAHGTATIYNDEMESKALNIAGVAHASLHSLKGYIGHTLGAAGVIESIIANMAMQQNTLLASPNYEHIGVPEPVNVQQQTATAHYDYLLKTASGFGGCNAALVWKAVR